MAGGVDLLLELGLDVVGEPLAGRDEHAGRQHVVLGLADQVGGHESRVGRVVGEHGDLGRAGLGVDPDDALEQPLCRDGVDRARPGHKVHAAARASAVGEHRDRLGAAHGVDLVDAQQRARGQDRRVRQAVVVLLRRRRECDRAHAGRLGGHHVHDHAGDQWRDAARHVEADPVDRDHPVGDGGLPEVRSPRRSRALPRTSRAGGRWTPRERPARPGRASRERPAALRAVRRCRAGARRRRVR